MEFSLGGIFAGWNFRWVEFSWVEFSWVEFSSVEFSWVEFSDHAIKYLGHVVDCSGIHVDKDKVKAISEMMPPTNVKMVRSFLGACGYYRKFIKDYSKIAAPLTELTKKGRQFKWTESCQDAFDCLKSKLF